MMKVFDVYKSCIPKIPERAVRSIDDIVGRDEEVQGVEAQGEEAPGR
jgi:hypothetical protein